MENNGKIEIVLTLQKDTKHKAVYGDDSVDSPLASVYVSKSALPELLPLNLKFTIEIP